MSARAWELLANCCFAAAMVVALYLLLAIGG